MPANSRWDLIRRLRVNGKHVKQMFAYPVFARDLFTPFLLALPVLWKYQTQYFTSPSS